MRPMKTLKSFAKEKGAVLPLVALILPVLLFTALYSLSVSYTEVVREEMQLAADAAALVGLNARKTPQLYLSPEDWTYTEEDSRAVWNVALRLSIDTLRQNRLHGMLGQTIRFPAMNDSSFMDPRDASIPAPIIPEWLGEVSVRINRGWITDGGFQSLEGAAWQAEHPGVLKYALFSAVKVEISRSVGMFSWLGLRSSHISASSLAAFPHDDPVLVAPFALPMCAVSNLPNDMSIDWTLQRSSQLCSLDKYFSGIYRRGTFESSGSDAYLGSCPAGGCISRPEFTWEPKNFLPEEIQTPGGVCNWGTSREGSRATDSTGILSNYGVVGLPVARRSTGEEIGFYSDYDPVHNPDDIYRESEISESTVKELISNSRDGLPLVKAALGWRFVVLPEGLTGSTDSLPGGRIDDVIWSQINKVPFGSAVNHSCKDGLSPLLCDHPPFGTALSFTDLSQKGGFTPAIPEALSFSWDVPVCIDHPLDNTQGLCRSRMVPNVIADDGVCKADVSAQLGSVWSALIPVIADVRWHSPSEPGGPSPPCSMPLDTADQRIIGFVRMNFFDVDINNGVYKKPLECTTAKSHPLNPDVVAVPFQDVGAIPPDPGKPTWGFVSPLDGQGCNLVRGRAACNQVFVGTSAMYTSEWPEHLETISE